VSCVTTAVRYFHTVRYLRARQIVARLWQPFAGRKAPRGATPALREPGRQYVLPVERQATLLAPDLFEFHCVQRTCATAADWQPPDRSKLWVYNLHYFDDLNARGAADRKAWHSRLLERWVSENPTGTGVGWEPYPVSLRMTNWVKSALRGNELPQACTTSLADQARWLLPRIEHRVLGNHLIANAKALIHAGLYFKGAEAERWLSRGMALLARELNEQILADGGHFELSPMYHAGILEDLLDVLNLLKTYDCEVPDGWTSIVERMQRWLRLMSHPDGDIAFFNDAAFGIAPAWQALQRYAERLELHLPAQPVAGLTVLPVSGYLCVSTDVAYLVCDCASIGPDYLPAHAHADTLSFEFSLLGRRLLVNSGTSEYGSGAERQRQRGTPAHNTVTVDGEDSSEVWAGFRVARRARARVVNAVTEPHFRIEGSHDGYRRLERHSTHRRYWTLMRNALLIEDVIEGRFASAEAYFHLHPDLEIREASQGSVNLVWPAAGLAVLATFQGASEVKVLEGTWHPGFGLALPNRRVKVSFGPGGLTTSFRWV
jgi:uncharacterized heparinase superfamily protein